MLNSPDRLQFLFWGISARLLGPALTKHDTVDHIDENTLSDLLEPTLTAHFQAPLKIVRSSACAGGDINQCFTLKLEVDGQPCRLFVKINSAIRQPMLESEKESLVRIAKLRPRLTLPKPLALVSGAKYSALILSHLDLKPRLTNLDFDALADNLYELHQCTNEKFGWQKDNYIGTNEQSNDWTRNWGHFWYSHRLEPQWRNAMAQNANKPLANLEDSLFKAVDQILSQHQPTPVLCHGDLWVGNIGALINDTACFFDPAAYFGDAETDLAMARLFGGFPENFFNRYHAYSPPVDGCTQRMLIYQLYHLLNHLNMFGENYLYSAITHCNKIINY